MERFIIDILDVRNVAQIFHWQTKSFAQHTAADEFLKNITKVFDKMVEAHLGRYGKIDFSKSDASIPVTNVNKDAFKRKLELLSEKLERHTFPCDTDSYKCEIIAIVHRTLYLLSLE